MAAVIIPKRVVVTGLGVVSPLGTGIPHFWSNLTKGNCGIVNLKDLLLPPSSSSSSSSSSSAVTEDTLKRWEKEDLTKLASLPSTVAAIVQSGSRDQGLFDPREWLSAKELQDIPLSIKYAMVAAEQALADANWNPTKVEDRELTGVAVGSGFGSMSDIVTTSRHFDQQGLKKVSPYFVPKILVNMAAGHISIKHGLMGPNHSVSTACATGVHAIGDAFRMIMFGDAKVMVAGGCEASVDPLSMAGFARMRALSSKFNDTPTKASRPFDTARNGFVMGEGAGIVILEELEHAKSRGAKIYCEVSGYGMSGDAYHITSPSPEARGAILCMKRALKGPQRAFDPAEVDYVNAHATSTPVGDEIELRAISTVFGQRSQPIPVSSIKGSIGHLLGAAGTVEAIATILTMKEGLIPATINLDNPIKLESGGDGVNLIAHQAKKQNVNIALTNSFGFGGTNASLLFSKLD